MNKIICFVLLLLPFLSKAQEDSVAYREHVDSLIDRFFNAQPEPLYRFVKDISYSKEKRQANWFYNVYLTGDGDSLVCFGLQFPAANAVLLDEQYILLNGSLVYAGSNRRIHRNSQTGVKEEEHLGGIEYYFRNEVIIGLRAQPYGHPPAGWDTPAYALSQFRERKKLLQSWLEAHPRK
jgi:hypothetical protein